MNLPRTLLATVALAAALSVLPCRAAPAGGVDWIEVAGEPDLERAVARSRGAQQPLLLYWGAAWCPPCNYLSATLFNRQEFAERARALVPVHLDGDAPGAQRIGARYKVLGYPTLVLLSPEGRELTRIVGSGDALQVLDLLDLGMAGGRPIDQVLADARAGRSLNAGEWRALAFAGWDDDALERVSDAERGPLLARLAAACPPEQADASLRLLLLSLAQPGAKASEAQRRRVASLLGDAAAVRRQADLLAGYPAELTRAIAPPAAAPRRAWLETYDRALRGLQADASLARADRLGALLARVDLARAGGEVEATPGNATRAAASRDPDAGAALPAALRAEARVQAEAADREVSAPDERGAVVPLAAQLLARSGSPEASTALLEANLATSKAPYYLMLQLASNARARGDKAAALDWYQRAYERSVGPATRLQWGAGYVNALVELAPKDLARVERAAGDVLAQATRADAFSGRSVRSLQRISKRLAGLDGAAPTVRRLHAQLRPTCDSLPAASPERSSCDALFAPRAGAGS